MKFFIGFPWRLVSLSARRTTRWLLAIVLGWAACSPAHAQSGWDWPGFQLHVGHVAWSREFPGSIVLGWCDDGDQLVVRAGDDLYHVLGSRQGDEHATLPAPRTKGPYLDCLWERHRFILERSTNWVVGADYARAEAAVGARILGTWPAILPSLEGAMVRERDGRLSLVLLKTQDGAPSWLQSCDPGNPRLADWTLRLNFDRDAPIATVVGRGWGGLLDVSGGDCRLSERFDLPDGHYVDAVARMDGGVLMCLRQDTDEEHYVLAYRPDGGALRVVSQHPPVEGQCQAWNLPRGLLLTADEHERDCPRDVARGRELTNLPDLVSFWVHRMQGDELSSQKVLTQRVLTSDCSVVPLREDIVFQGRAMLSPDGRRIALMVAGGVSGIPHTWRTRLYVINL